MSTHTDNPERGNPDDSLCKNPCTMPKGAKAYCYAQDERELPETQKTDQFCAYESKGFLEGAPGCCKKPCPGECKSGVSAPPEKMRSKGVVDKKKHKKKDDPDTPKPFPRLLVILGIILAVLVVAASIFLVLGN